MIPALSVERKPMRRGRSGIFQSIVQVPAIVNERLRTAAGT